MTLAAYRRWFYAAAIYNFVWGTVTVLAPNLFFGWVHMPLPAQPWMWQCIGMLVLVYALGYWLIATAPRRLAPLVWVGIAGKILGPVGFVFSAVRGDLPWVFGWTNLFNDVIWLPVFVSFAFKYARPPFGE